MPRRFFKRYMPHPDRLKAHKSLRFLGTLTHDPNLLHLNRHSVSRAMAIGLFWAMIPMPLQMLVAALCAVPARANLPIAVGLVWLTNPLTMPPVFYCNYKVGAWLMDTPVSRCRWNSAWPGCARCSIAIGSPCSSALLSSES